MTPIGFLITEPPTPWGKVKAALRNPKYDFRTAEGICRETGLPADEVQALLDDHKDELRILLATDSKNRPLYTLRERPMTLREVLFNIKAVVSATSSAT